MNKKKEQGFSLIEIVLALGIISIGLVAILGLVATSMTSSKDSKDDTNVALMLQAVNAQLQAQLRSQLGPAGYNAFYNNTNYSEGDNTADYFFDVSGNLIRDTSGNIVTTASNIPSGTVPLYSCTVKIKDPANFPSTLKLSNPPDGGLVFIQLDFAWPYGAPLPNQHHKFVLTSLAKYDDL